MPLNELISAPLNALNNAYQNNVDMRKRVYGESLLKSFTGRTDTPITNDSFSSEEQQALDALVKQHYAQKMAQFQRPRKALLANAQELEKAAEQELGYAKTIDPSRTETLARITGNARRYSTIAQQLRDAAEGKLPTDFAFGYMDYGERIGKNVYDNDPKGWAQTLGRFRYKVDPATGSYEVYDKYDFNNEAHKYNAENYAEMSAPKRLFNALLNTSIGDQYALGEAYLAGKNAVPVTIKGKLK